MLVLVTLHQHATPLHLPPHNTQKQMVLVNMWRNLSSTAREEFELEAEASVHTSRTENSKDPSLREELDHWKIVFLPGVIDKHSLPLQLSLNLNQVELLLEGLWHCSELSICIDKAFPGLKQIYSTYNDEEKNNIQTQIASLEIPASGSHLVLDPTKCSQMSAVDTACSNVCPSVTTRPKRQHKQLLTITSKAQIALSWMCENYSKYKVQKLPFRLSEFTLNGQGMLHSSPDAVVYLLLEPEVSKKVNSEEKILSPEVLLVVKVAENDEGKLKLLKEATVIERLQHTG